MMSSDGAPRAKEIVSAGSATAAPTIERGLRLRVAAYYA